MMELIRERTSTTWAAIAAFRSRLAEQIAARGIVLVLDQIVASGTNFVTTIAIGRACLQQELGLYALGFSLVVMALRIPRALIWTPFTSFLPSLDEEEGKRYGGSVLIHQLALCGALACTISLLGVVAIPLTQTGGLGKLLIVLGPAMALMVLREHARRFCFARLRADEALLIDVAVCALQVGGMLALAFTDTLTAVRAYLVIAAASAPVFLVWLIASRHAMTFSRAHIVPDFLRDWTFARWLLVGEVVIGVTALLDPWALSFMYDTRATGVLAAAMSVIALANPLVLSFQNFFGPYAAHAYAKSGLPGLARNVRTATVVMAGLAAVFTLFVATWGEQALVLAYGEEYVGLGAVVVSLVLAECAELVSLPANYGLVVLGRSDLLLKSYLIQLVLTATLGMVLIYQWGPVGVGFGAMISNSGAGVWRWLAFWKLARHA